MLYVFFESAAGEEPRGERQNRVPEHDKDVCHMVHPAFVNVLQFFVGRGHKQQARGH
jgi:hypothetical protein